MPELPEAGSPQTVLFAKVRDGLNKVPFEPFRIVTTAGRSYEIPTADHAATLPRLRMIYIARDDGGDIEIHALHVAAIETIKKSRKRRAA